MSDQPVYKTYLNLRRFYLLVLPLILCFALMVPAGLEIGGVVGYVSVIMFFFMLIFAIIIPRKYAAKPMHIFYDDRVWLRLSDTVMYKDDIELIRWEKNGASILPKGYQSAGFMEKHHLNQKYEGSMIGILFIKDLDKLEAFLKDWIGENKIRTKDLFEL